MAKYVTFRLDRNQSQTLDYLAAITGRTKQSHVDEAVLLYLQEHAPPPNVIKLRYEELMAKNNTQGK